jgi:predicted negative regulator of RcsB-dependent stress response
MGRYHQARILVQQGKKDEAAQLLADLKSAQPESAAGRLATERLAVLAAQGVKVPEPKAPPAAQQQDAG